MIKKVDEFKNILGRIITNAYSEFQIPRISFMNQIRDVIRKRIEGIKFNEVEEKKEEKKRVKKYTDTQLIKKWNEAHTKGLINSVEHDYMLEMWNNAKKMKGFEIELKKKMLDYVSTIEIYKVFLDKIRGVGEILSANLIKEFGDCSQYDTTSKLWAHSGQSVINGKAPQRKKGELISYSPKLKTLVWKLSDSLLKQNKGYYRDIYNTEKIKQEKREFDEGVLFEKYGKPYKKEDTKLTKLHIHNRALRKMRKIFLSHFWECGRELAGLDYKKTYVEGVLNHSNIITWREAIDKEGMLLEVKDTE